ncbi:IS66 family transposase, partial [Escherichia coli]
ERGIAGPGLLARVLTSKYAEHTPLYCQSEIYGRQGVELSRSLLSGNKKTKTGRLWAYVRDDRNAGSALA